MVRDFSDRIVTTASGCWLWTGSISRDGYGRVRYSTPSGRRQKQAHRVVYEHERGPIPAGLTLDHLCRVKACVNPDHLEPVTHRENVLRGVGPTATNARKATCIRGHSLDRLDSEGHRRCSACKYERRAL